MTLKLNGWQRLWVVFSVPSILLGLLFLLTEKNLSGDDEAIIAYLIIGPFAFYAAVVVGKRIIHWVKAGFRA